MREDLRRFKQLLEAGEIATTDGQPRGECMKAVCWYGNERRPRRDRSPTRRSSTRATRSSRSRSTAICGSDLHLYDGFIPTMEKGDILGHEFMGEVVEVGSASQQPARSATASSCPFTIACGNCFFCKRELWSRCDNSNPNAWMAEKLYGYSRARACSATRT